MTNAGYIFLLLIYLEEKKLNSIPEPIGKFDGFYYIIEYLSGLKTGLTVEELSKEIGKSEKTVRRYLDSMEHSIFDIDLIKERGYDRKYRYRIEKHATPFRPIFLNSYEIVALNFIRGFSHFNDFPVIQENLNNIFRKISLSAKESLEKTGNDFQGRVSNLFVVPHELGGKVYVEKEQVSHLEKLIKAAIDGNDCSMVYGAGDMRKEYKIIPLHLFNYRDVIYIVAKDINDKEVAYKNFALHRVRFLKVVEENCHDYPDNFNIDEYMKENMFKFEGIKYLVSLRFSADVKDYILERQWFPDQDEEINKDGSVKISFKNEINLMLLSWIRGFGPDVEVLEPEILRVRMENDLNKSLGNYK